MRKHKAYEIRNAINNIIADIPDEQAVECAVLFPLWQADIEYKYGDRVRYNDDLYKVITSASFNSQATWTPDVSPSLFSKILPGQEGTEIGEWVQPDSTNPYMRGDRVTYNSQMYESVVDGNVWAPGIYGWELVQ